MPQLLDRFLRTVSAGKYGSKELLDVRRLKAERATAALAVQLQRLEQMKLAAKELPALKQKLDAARAALTTACAEADQAQTMQQFAKACDRLEPIKKQAVAALAEARKLETPVLDKYLKTKTPGQQKVIRQMADLCDGQLKEPLETPEARRAFAERLNALEQDLQKQGLDAAETGAVKSSFLKRNLAFINPELNGVFNDPGYDAANDPTLKELKPTDLKQFLLQWDMTGFRAQELKGRIAKGIKGNPGPTELKDFFAKNPTFKTGLLSLLKPEYVPRRRRNAWAGPQVESLSSVDDTPTDAELTEILANTDPKQGKVSFADMLQQPGQANSYSGGFPYSGLIDSTDRMERKAKLLRQVLAAPSLLPKLVQQKEADLQKLKAALPDQKSTAQDPLPGGLSEEELAKKKKEKAQAGYVFLQAQVKIKQLEREIEDAKEIKQRLERVEELKGKTAPTDDEKQELARHRLDLDNLDKISRLSEAERFAIVAYTSDFYKQINSPLRGQGTDMLVNADPDILKWFKVLQSALNKLPAYEGVSFRGDGKGNHTKLRQEGEEVADFAFSSTATEVKAAIGFAGSGMLSISRTKSGRRIAALSHYGAGEAEVLMRPLTTLVTKARLELPDGKTWDDVFKDPKKAALLDGLDDKTKLQIRKSGAKVLTFMEEV